jgi:hypothetical protein
MNIRDISASDLAKLGTPRLAYLRQVMMNGERAVAIHAADGTPMAIAANLDLAVETVMEQEMFLMSVH